MTAGALWRAWLLAASVAVFTSGRGEAHPLLLGIETGVSMRQESSGEHSPHPWVGARGSLAPFPEQLPWLRVNAAYGVSFGSDGRQFAGTMWQHRLSLVPEATLSLGTSRLFAALGVAGELRVVTFETQDEGFAGSTRALLGPTGAVGVETDVHPFQVRFSLGASVLQGRVDGLFTVSVSLPVEVLE